MSRFGAVLLHDRDKLFRELRSDSVENGVSGDDVPPALCRSVLVAMDRVNARDLVKLVFDIKHSPGVNSVDGNYTRVGQENVLLLDRLPV